MSIRMPISILPSDRQEIGECMVKTLYPEDSSLIVKRPGASNTGTTAFEDGLEIFKAELTADPKKRARLDAFKAARLEDVLSEIASARDRYAAKRAYSTTRECIVAFSKRVHYYGKIMDVMAQHHAEYASLAWGMMKFTFGVIIEHERLGITIVSAMNDIADAISRVELAESLYPTPEMKRTIAVLYSFIIKFLLRAAGWYESSSISRAFQSVTRPAALRYDDLIVDIEKSARKVYDLSAAKSQAEQRDIHIVVRQVFESNRELRDQLNEVQSQLCRLTSLSQQTHQDQIVADTALQSQMQRVIETNSDISAMQVDIKHQLSDVQLTQALTVISSSFKGDHKSAYQKALLLRQARRSSLNSKCAPFWMSPRLHSWDSTPASAQIMLKSTFRDRLNVRNFCTNVIEQLLQSQIATMWILKTQDDQQYSIFDVLKTLIYQALSLGYASHTDTTMAFELRRYQAAASVEDYVNILGELLQHLRLVYILIEWAAIREPGINECRKVLTDLFSILDKRGAMTVVKVLSFGIGAGGYERGLAGNMLKIESVPSRKHKSIPVSPLRGGSRLALRGSFERNSISR